MPSANRNWTTGGRPRPEAHVAGPEAEDRDREEVEDALDEDGPEGPAQRHGRVDLEEVGPVDVAELGRHEAVDEPADEDDLGAVARPDGVAAATQQERPSASRGAGSRRRRSRTPARMSSGLAAADDPRQRLEVEARQRPGEEQRGGTAAGRSRRSSAAGAGGGRATAARRPRGRRRSVGGRSRDGGDRRGTKNLHRFGAVRAHRAGRPSTDGPVAPRSSPALPPARRPGAGSAGSDPAVAARPLDDLGERRDEPGEVRRPARDELGARQGGQQARRRSTGRPSRAVYATPTSRVEWASLDGDPGQAVARGRRAPPARCPIRRAPGRCRPRPSRRGRPSPRGPRCGPSTRAAGRTDGARRRGRPARGPRRSSRRQGRPGGTARSRNTRDEVAVGGLDLLADDHRQAGRGTRHARAGRRRSGRGR